MSIVYATPVPAVEAIVMLEFFLFVMKEVHIATTSKGGNLQSINCISFPRSLFEPWCGPAKAVLLV